MIPFLFSDIKIVFFEYLAVREKISLATCSREWYEVGTKSIVRKVAWRDLVENKRPTIIDAYNQLALILTRDTVVNGNDIDCIFSSLDWRLYRLECMTAQFWSIMGVAPRLKVKHIIIQTIDFEEDCTDIVPIALRYCETLDLRMVSSIDTSIYKNMIFSMNYSAVRPCQLYSKETLRHVSLNECLIKDVSIFKSIPYLKLRYCRTIVDISSLNNNDHVVIEGCDGIQDYSQSFAFTRKIKIVLSSGQAISYFDLNRWNNVQELHLSSLDCYCEVKFPQNCNRLPRTVKKCILRRDFTSAIDFRVTCNHALKELYLSFNSTITSLEGYGLETVAIIKLNHMTSLQSLEGLGRGRNRKISIFNCDQVSDFSPLNHVPIVEIKYCSGFTDLLQVRCVRDLAIAPSVKIRLSSDLFDANPYRNIQTLRISQTHNTDSLKGLEKIPHLQLDYFDITCLQEYFEGGNKLDNQRIVLIFRGYVIDTNELLELHRRYLIQDYDYYYEKIIDRYSATLFRWIWTRKH